MNVLAIGCHPDDIEISCCGTLAKCVKRGDKVTVCHVANGNMGHEIISPEELREIRAKEAQNAGALAGIEVVTLDIGDLLPNGCNVEQRDMVVALIDDGATVKTFYKENGHIRLQPENDTMDPIIVDDCQIVGKVFGVFRFYR